MHIGPTNSQFYRPQGAPLRPGKSLRYALAGYWTLVIAGLIAGTGMAALLIWAFMRLVARA